MQILNYIRPNNNINLPTYSIFFEDIIDIEELCCKLEEQERYETESILSYKRYIKSPYNRLDKTALLEPDDSGVGQDYRRIAFSIETAINLPPQYLSTTSSDLQFNSATSPNINRNTLFPNIAPTPFAWSISNTTQHGNLRICFLQKADIMQNIDIIDQGLVDFEFDAIELYILLYNSDARHRGIPGCL